MEKKYIGFVLLLVWFVALGVARVLLAATQPFAQASDPAISQTHVVGEVVAIDSQMKQITTRTDAGSSVVVWLDQETSFIRAVPGETSLGKATPIGLLDIGVGDRVYARGRLNEANRSLSARQVIVMVKTDLQKRQEKERVEWRTQSVSGVVSAVNPEKKEIRIQIRGRGASSQLLILVRDEKALLRYEPESVRFSDARPCSFSEIKVGDQVRALGEKVSDGSHFRATKVISGSFQTVGGIITGINPESGEIQMTLLGGKQSLNVRVNKDSKIRRLSPQAIAALVQARLGSQPAAGISKPPVTTTAPAQQPKSEARPSESGFFKPPDQTRDLQELLDRLPPVTLAEMKPGDVVAVSSTVGRDPAHLTAITVLTGVDLLIRTLQQASGSGRRLPALGTGLPQGVLDFVMGQP